MRKVTVVVSTRVVTTSKQKGKKIKSESNTTFSSNLYKNVGKILYLVNFKACQDGEPHRHYTIILGYEGLLHSLARGWNHSVTSCKQEKKKKENKNTFLVNLLLTWVFFFSLLLLKV